MIRLIELNSGHYDDLHRVVVHSENLDSSITLEEFRMVTAKREGWAVLSDGVLIGSVTYIDYVPNLDIILHVTIDRNFYGRWINRSRLKEVFSLPLCDLGLERVSGYGIIGKTDRAIVTLERLGFEHEGTTRKGIIIHGKHFNLERYGLLKENCKWI